MSTIIISIIAVLMIASLFFTHVYSYVRIIFHYIFFLLGLLSIIWLSKVKLVDKLALSLILISYYDTNFYLLTMFFSTMFKYTVEIPPKYRKTDERVSKDILNCVKNVINVKMSTNNLPDRPTIMLCNYAYNQIENIFCITIPVKMSVIMQKFFKHFIGFGSIIKRPIYTEKNCYNFLKEEIPKHIAIGSSVFAYVTNIPYMGKKPYEIYKVKTGMFRLAKELDIPVTLVCIDYIFRTFDGYIPPQDFHIHIGDTFKVEDIRYSAKRSKTFFRNTLKQFHDNKLKTLYS